MSESEGSTPVLERTRPDSAPTQRQLTIMVERRGSAHEKELRFTTQNFTITDPTHIYNIRHVLGFEPTVDTTEICDGCNAVTVVLRRQQLVTEELVIKLAKSIGNALGFVHGFIDVRVGRLE
jgi:hypothetical protein